MNMTEAQYRKFAAGVMNRVGDYFDSYAIVGYHAQTGERVIIKFANEPAKADGLNCLMHAAANMPIILEPPEDGRPHE